MDTQTQAAFAPPLVTRLVIAPIAYQGMLNAVAQSAVETGGALMGTLAPEGTLIVGMVSAPGKNAVQTATRFEWDVDHVRDCVDGVSRLWPLGLVGEWHCHPSSPQYSPTDLEQMRRFTSAPIGEGTNEHGETSDWRLRAVVLIIFGRAADGAVNSMVANYLESDWALPIQLPWCVARYDDPLLTFAYGGIPQGGTGCSSVPADVSREPQADISEWQQSPKTAGQDALARDILPWWLMLLSAHRRGET